MDPAIVNILPAKNKGKEKKHWKWWKFQFLMKSEKSFNNKFFFKKIEPKIPKKLLVKIKLSKIFYSHFIFFFKS